MEINWNAVGSIATAVAVLVAIFGPPVHDRYLRRRREPRVSLLVRRQVVLIGVGPVWSGRQLLEYTLSNEAGRDVAENVQVYVTGRGHRDVDTTWSWLFGDSTLLLLGEGSVTTIPPNFSRRCTFGWLEVERGSEIGENLSAVGLLNIAEGSPLVINTGFRYDVTMTVVGSNFDALSLKGTFAVTRGERASGEGFVEAKWEQVPSA